MILGMLRRIRWSVSSSYKETSIGQSFSSIEKVFALPMLEAPVANDSESMVFLYRQDGQDFYVKRYHGTKGLRSWLGRSRLRGEWNNLKLFNELGIPAAKLVAYGEERLLTHAGRGALITAALPQTMDLATLALNEDDRLSDVKWVNKVIVQVAECAQKMHNFSFAHNDFKWRNILVDSDPVEPKVYLIDCPAGQRWYAPFLQHRMVKDLACLDKMGKYHLSRSQRMRFFKLYLGTSSRLTTEEKDMARRIVHFFEGRE